MSKTPIQITPTKVKAIYVRLTPKGTVAIDEEDWHECGFEECICKGVSVWKEWMHSIFKATKPGERWITVHPNGKDEKGVPIRLRATSDGVWTVAGGAGGKLNGLRMHHVKSEEEYKKIAAEKRRDRAAQKKVEEREKENARIAELEKEVKAKNQDASDDDIKKLAQQQLDEEKTKIEDAKRERTKTARKREREQESKLVDEVAAAAGWDKSKLSPPEELLNQRAMAVVRKRKNELAAAISMRKGGKKELTVKEREKVAKAAAIAAAKAKQRIKDAYRKAAVKKAKEYLDNQRDAVVDAGESLAETELGEVGVGDLAKTTLGDSGKGFMVNMQEEAAARGILLDPQAVEAKKTREDWDSAIQRKDGDIEAAVKARTFVERMQERAAETRKTVKDAIEQLGMEGTPIEDIAELDATPKAKNTQEAVNNLAKAKQIQENLKRIQKEKKGIDEADGFEEIDAVPSAVIVEAETLTSQQAIDRIKADIEEQRREKAMDRLIDIYDQENKTKPIRSHLVTGQTSYLDNVAHVTGVGVPDPLMVDTIGEGATAQLMVAVLADQYADDAAGFEGVKKAIEQDHIEKQVELANKAAEFATRTLAEAKSMKIPDIVDMDTMDGALQLNQERLELHREAREAIGLTMGRLQAAGALNDALSKKPVTEMNIPLGVMGTKDAIRKAAAIGLGLDDYTVFNDGKNKFLEVNQTGVNKLKHALTDSPEHARREKLMEDIKSGKKDDEDWLPAGFSRRPRIDLSNTDDAAAMVNIDTQFDINASEDVGDTIKGYIARRMEMGHSPIDIAADLRSEDFMTQNIPEKLRDNYYEALNAAVPFLKQSKDTKAGDQLKHNQRVERLMNEYHRQYLEKEAERLGLTGKDGKAYATVQSQQMPMDNEAIDVLHQVNIRDPRLRNAFSDVGSLGRDGRKAVREYAYEKLLTGTNGEKLDPKDSETPIQAMSDTERKAYDAWRKHEGSGDAYGSIQAAWRKEVTSSGGDTPKAPDFATVDLNDDKAVLKVANDHAEKLGYSIAHKGFDPKTGSYTKKVAAELQVTDGQSEAFAARDARRRIQEALMQHMVERQGAKSTFRPDNVKTASNRWAQFVSDMAGERNAYIAVMDHMKGDFAQQFATGYKQTTGRQLRGVNMPVSSSELYARATMTAEQRKNADSLKASEMARLRNREGGRFAAGSVKEGLEAKRENEAMGLRLFGESTGKAEETRSGMSRFSIGRAAESQIAALIPDVRLSHGTSAIGGINMSKGNYVRQQRAIKQIIEAKRVGMSLGTGSGKTPISLGALSQLRADGKVKRAIFAVPSVVQEQFGSEAARFYDPTSPATPKWVADPSLSATERRKAYKDDSGKDAVVVTHQALRDDINWALAQDRFKGDEKAASTWMATAPEEQRIQAVQQAVKRQGWNFEMSIIDEGHNLLNRAGKKNSAMANTIDAFTRNKPYHASLSADPVKNDASEAFSFLAKIAPERYVEKRGASNQKGVVTRSEFIRKYGANTLAAKEALQREMAPYQYAESIKPDVKAITKVHKVAMPDAQRKAMQDVKHAYRAARRARKEGRVDVEAIKVLSPGSFDGLNAQQAKARAKRLQENLGIIRDTAFDRIVNQFPDGAKMRWLEHRLGIKEYPEFIKMGVKASPPSDKPKIIFAHNIGTVNAIVEKLKASGIRVGKMTGENTGDEKEAAKLGFSPQFDDNTGDYVTPPEFDVLVSSDAGAVGWNGQRAQNLINYDVPHTAMVIEQRNGRSVRTGQRNDVDIDTIVTDTPYEAKRYKRLQRKRALREALTTPAEAIDDSGLAARIARETDLARERLVRKQAKKAA